MICCSTHTCLMQYKPTGAVEVPVLDSNFLNIAYLVKDCTVVAILTDFAVVYDAWNANNSNQFISWTLKQSKAQDLCFQFVSSRNSSGLPFSLYRSSFVPLPSFRFVYRLPASCILRLFNFTLFHSSAFILCSSPLLSLSSFFLSYLIQCFVVFRSLPWITFQPLYVVFSLFTISSSSVLLLQHIILQHHHFIFSYSSQISSLCPLSSPMYHIPICFISCFSL